MWNVVTVSLRQRVVPGHLLGRVNSVYRMLGWGLMPFGALAGGFVAHAAGLRAPYLVAGLVSRGVLPGKSVLDDLDGACSVPAPHVSYRPAGALGVGHVLLVRP